MKSFGVLALLVIAACVAESYAQSHNVVFGSIQPGDRKLFQQIVMKKAKTLRVVSEDVQYPPKGVVGQNLITGIRVTDQYTNGKGGYSTLVAGGPGQRDVTLHFKSQRGHGYNFIVEYYGR
uniref:Venom polypeptide n=1 Tax=Dolopus genitalis TaxID=2488630 RepID=A0A3G5BIA7_DOLGE|nr:venom polypeptide [Dolopus genitalis]